MRVLTAYRWVAANAATIGGDPKRIAIGGESVGVLRSQGQEFARKLQAAGVATQSSYYKGAMHEFFGASAVFDLAEQAQQEAAEHLMRAFSGHPPLYQATGASVSAVISHRVPTRSGGPQ